MKKWYTFDLDVFCLVNYWLAYPEDNLELWEMVKEWRKYDPKVIDHIIELAKLYSVQKDVFSQLNDLVGGIKWNYSSFTHKIDLAKVSVESKLYWRLSGLYIEIELDIKEEEHE